MGRKRKIPLRNFICSICDLQIEETHIHHIIERHDGGPNEEWNLLELCPNCHSKNHLGNLKILEIVFSSGGYLVSYTDNGEHKYKKIIRK